MSTFLETADTIDPALGLGFSLFSPLHWGWLAFLALFTCVVSLLYRSGDCTARVRWRRGLAFALVADELFKMAGLFIGGNYMFDYLPLHLCSINILLIAVHAFRPSRTLDNFLYTVCIPGALAALLFPTWTELPFFNFMHLHSFTVHTLLAAYPIVLTVGGDIRPDIRYVPRCLLLLLGMAIPIYGINRLLDTNFMFLMDVEPGNPLYPFEQAWGNHLYGFPVLIAAVIAVMYAPVYASRALRRLAAQRNLAA